MQDQINEKTVSLVIRGGKLTARLFAKALKILLDDLKKAQQKASTPKTYQGKQSVDALVKQGAGVTNIEITDAEAETA